MSSDTKDIIICTQCGKEFLPESKNCPHCFDKKTPPIPNYPRFGGKVFLVFWVFFLVLVVAWLVSMFSF